MNGAVSLPRLRSNTQFSKPLNPIERKRSIERKIIAPNKEQKLQNGQQQIKNVKMQKLTELKRAKSEIFKKRNHIPQTQQQKQKKYGLLESGKLSKITENSILSKDISSVRTRSSRLQPYEKQQTAALKKELNEIISSILILKKQIKSIEGGTLQVKQQIKSILENNPHQNSQTDKKIEEVRKKTESVKYDQQVLKNMKDRMKKTNLFYERKAMELKQILEKEEKKIKILQQKSSIREQSINKHKVIIKYSEQKEKLTNRINELAANEYQSKMKEMNLKKEMAQKKAGLKLINEHEFHYEVYKKQEEKLFSQLRANQFVNQWLDLRWNKYSEIYSEAQKAQKLMLMHSLQKTEEQFDPKKIYYGSFENKKQLEDKIKEKENKLAQMMKRNTELAKIWKNLQFKQIDEQQIIFDKKSLEIKTGKIEEKQIIEKQQRELILEMRKKLQKSKQRAAKISRIKDWVLKLQSQLQIKQGSKRNIEERLMQVISWASKQYKKQKNIQNKTL